MTADFSVGIDPVASEVRLTLVGFFLPADVLKLGNAIRAEYQKLIFKPNRHRTLLDLRAMAIQSKETLIVFTVLLNDPKYQAERLAIVYSHTLVRMQIARVAATRDSTRFFDDVRVAEAWLSEPRTLVA